MEKANTEASDRNEGMDYQDPQEGLSKCRQCKQNIPKGARLCSKCNSYQDWRGYLSVSSTVLALLVALLSAATTAAPAIKKALHKPRPEIVVGQPYLDRGDLRVVISNQGDAPASIGRGRVSIPAFPHLRIQAVLRDDKEAIVLPGSKQLFFDLILFPDFGDGPHETWEELTTNEKKPKSTPRPKLEIEFHPKGAVVSAESEIDWEQLLDTVEDVDQRCRVGLGTQRLIGADATRIERQCGIWPPQIEPPAETR